MTDPRSIPIRFSNLKEMRRSPAHYRHLIDTERKDSPALRIGRMVHYGVLGGLPDDEEGHVAIYEGERRGNAWKDFAAAHASDEIVTRAEYSRAEPIIAAVRADPIAARYLEGELEKRIDWEFAGRACRSTLDVHSPGKFVADLKTTTDASIVGLQRQAWRMAYHAQLAYYGAAVESLTGVPLLEALIIGVEVAPPHIVTVLRLSPGVLAEGTKSWRAWFETLRTCEDSDQWPGYAQQPVTWEVPEWIDAEGQGDGDE